MNKKIDIEKSFMQLMTKLILISAGFGIILFGCLSFYYLNFNGIMVFWLGAITGIGIIALIKIVRIEQRGIKI